MSGAGERGAVSLCSEMSELTEARLLGRLLPWLGAGLHGLVTSSNCPVEPRIRPRLDVGVGVVFDKIFLTSLSGCNDFGVGLCG